MRLKKIELFGFKSFADKTELYFEDGVTAIVGPNGVGKSNIAEAIKWVLGEQSARELRGLRMEDVIFNGTENRPPVNFSEVCLSFTNKEKKLPIDYDEVTVTRRVFRTGEGQYLLNKTPVRLKDITALFMGTGVGIDSYSIIGQGKIDLVLSSKPEERRYIFEEAAGITKYKSQKREALRKLEQTENNLLRAVDIIKEVSRQIGSIARQVKKAESYSKKFEELKEKELKLSCFTCNNLKESLDTIFAEEQKTREQEKFIFQEIEKTNQLFLEAKEKLFEIDEALNKLYSKKTDLEAQIKNANDRIVFDIERVNEISARWENLENIIQSTEIKLRELQEQIQKSKKELNNLHQDKVSKTEEMRQKEAALQEINGKISESEKNIKQHKEKIFETTASESKSKSELAKISADEANARARLRRLRTEKEEVEKHFVLIGEKLNAAANKKSERGARLDFLKKEREQALSNAAAHKKKVQELEQQNIGLNQKYISFQSKAEYLKDLQQRFEGYQDGVKSILIAKSQNQLPRDEIFDSIANLIEVEKEYERAVEAALGEKAQILAVKDDDVVKKCIEFLKSKELGSAAFISVDALMSVGETADAENLGLIALISVIKTKAGFERVIEHLFKNVFIIENIETAFLYQKKLKNENIKLVTREGDLVQRYLMAACAGRINEDSLIGREARINFMEKEAEGYKMQINQKENLLAREKEQLNKLEKVLQKADAVIQEAEINLANASLNIKASEDEKKRIDGEISVLNAEISETEEEKNKIVMQRQQVEEQIIEINKSSFELNSFMNNSEDFIKGIKNEREDLLVKATRLKTELTALTDFEINQNQTIKMFENSENEQKDLLLAQKLEIENSKKKIEKLNSDAEARKKDVHLLEENCQTALADFEQAIRLKENRLQKIKEFEGLLADKRQKTEELKSRLNNFQLKTTEIKYQMQNLKERLLDHYKVDPEKSEIVFEKEFDFDQLKSEIDNLKEKLNSMGPVNLVAIEEHKELQERFDFLNKQHNDLQEAKESLHTAITKINKTTKKLFLETFQNIQSSFRDFYKLLFGGGEANLILLDESDVLESGIEIEARPPGKKLQNISLLSGGEKALTAIALLFAVFKVKPSPFCVLDEIDAALDEANVDRFINVLQDFLKTSQFIIITHNKKTISMADIMYGVTMEETGISKIVSVKLKSGLVENSNKIMEEVTDSQFLRE